MNNTTMKQYGAPIGRSLLAGACLSFALISCTPAIPSNTGGSSGPVTPVTPVTNGSLTKSSPTDAVTSIGSAKAAYATPVTNVTFTGPTATVTLKGLAGHSVFLAKFNAGSSGASLATTGGVSSSYASGNFATFASSADAFRSVSPSAISAPTALGVPFPSGITRFDHPGAQAMNADPLSVAVPGGPARSIAASAPVSAPAASYIVGTSTKEFQVANQDKPPYDWFPVNATLAAEGSHCYVWVASGNDATSKYTKTDNNLSDASTAEDDNMITTAQAKNLADVFDKVYPIETGVLGYEFGGDPASTMLGGWDGDTKISILIYDISGNYSKTQQSGILGYFWDKDERSKGQFYYGTNVYQSNGAEIFYIDSFFADKYPSEIESTLIHEFQHMIGYNQKKVINKYYSSTWFDEMLSMASEEVIGTAVGLDPKGLPWGSRIPSYTVTYDWLGLADWQEDSQQALLASYSNSYAFGSYLLHNYGGVPLLQELEQNKYVDKDSVINAVKKLNPDLKDDAQVIAQLSRYSEALVFGGTNTPPSVNTFCKAGASLKLADGTVVSLPAGNDITSVKNVVAGNYIDYDMGNNTNFRFTVPASYTGVLAFPVTVPFGLNPGGMRVYTDASWQNVTGDFVITLKRPTKADGTPNTDVSLSLYVR